jgi:hypothetical protein
VRRQGRHLTVSRLVVSVSVKERDAQGHVAPVEALNAWLKVQESIERQPLLAISPMTTTDPLMYVGSLVKAPLVELLDFVAAQPWRQPACVQLFVIVEGEKTFRLLTGLKEIVEARTKAASGSRQWWKTGALATREAKSGQPAQENEHG